ncbi:hypothetical protein HM1_0558 [Heliomicrobium modesticaldum Ice1]|uniref:HPt domain-containing protein n=1 Tax=Heliobacterium modesticaldum (strain ATCC 51547 / Ice1) TaxID=498761 RepID=B0TG15_HELMI|nr:Hpt domain-containing protein [Heliomicrobium modesticaldum]ABZ83172.1 hypothetical protein HM1_0558 [Heliomicrobium modesticaldum Ice1]
MSLERLCDEEVIDRKAVISLLKDVDPKESRELFVRLVEIYLKETPKRIKALAEAFATGSSAEARQSAHSLKSSSAMLGIYKVAELSRQIEQYAKDGALAEAYAIQAALERECDRACACLRLIRDSGFPTVNP